MIDLPSREEISDTGLGRRAETRSRSVRIRNLPPDTQEGLLQQVLERHAVVKRVEVLMAEREAIVELENAAVRCRFVYLESEVDLLGCPGSWQADVESRTYCVPGR